MPDCALAPSIGSPISALPAASRAAQRPTPDLAALERVLAEARQQRAGHVAGLLSGGGRTAVASGARRGALRTALWCCWLWRCSRDMTRRWEFGAYRGRSGRT